MAAVKRSKAERTAELAEMAELLAKGASHRDLMRSFGLARGTIQRDVQEIEEGWRERAAGEIDEWKGRQLARLESIWQEAMSAWVKSIGLVEETTVRDSAMITGQVIQLETRKTYESAGNPKYLDQANAALAEINKVIGLHAQTTTNVIVRRMVEETAQELGIEPSDLMAEIEAAAAEAWERSR